jgi:hypothetical protein
MTDIPAASIPKLLIESIARELLMAIEDALMAGAQRAFKASRGINEGHLPHALGQLRHFHMNEAFHSALAAANASPTPINGNGVICGRAGKFNLARFNTSSGVWNHGRRSETRKRLSEVNKALEPLVQPELFREYVEPSIATVFIVACFAGVRYRPETPLEIQIAVPDRNMRGWLFREPIQAFVNRYYQGPPVQIDGAKPKLRSAQQRKKRGDGE